MMNTIYFRKNLIIGGTALLILLLIITTLFLRIILNNNEENIIVGNNKVENKICQHDLIGLWEGSGEMKNVNDNHTLLLDKNNNFEITNLFGIGSQVGGKWIENDSYIVLKFPEDNRQMLEQAYDLVDSDSNTSEFEINLEKDYLCEDKIYFGLFEFTFIPGTSEQISTQIESLYECEFNINEMIIGEWRNPSQKTKYIIEESGKFEIYEYDNSYYSGTYKLTEEGIGLLFEINGDSYFENIKYDNDGTELTEEFFVDEVNVIKYEPDNKYIEFDISGWSIGENYLNKNERCDDIDLAINIFNSIFYNTKYTDIEIIE